MRAFLLGVGCAIIGVAGGFAGGYAYNEMHSSSGTTVCNREPTGGIDLTTGKPGYRTVCARR